MSRTEILTAHSFWHPACDLAWCSQKLLPVVLDMCRSGELNRLSPSKVKRNRQGKPGKEHTAREAGFLCLRYQLGNHILLGFTKTNVL